MTEKALKEAGDKVDADTKKAIEEKVAALKTALGGEDAEAMKKATDELLAESQKIGQQMYQQNQDAASGQPTSETPSEGEVVDTKPEEPVK